MYVYVRSRRKLHRGAALGAISAAVLPSRRKLHRPAAPGATSAALVSSRRVVILFVAPHVAVIVRYTNLLSVA